MTETIIPTARARIRGTRWHRNRAGRVADTRPLCASCHLPLATFLASLPAAPIGWSRLVRTCNRGTLLREGACEPDWWWT